MKRWLLILILLLPLAGTAQNRAFDEFYQSYAAETNVRSIELGRKMMEMMRRDADPELARLLDGIRSIRILAAQKPYPFLFRAQAYKVARDKAFELISRTDSKGPSVSFYFIEGSGERLSELLMLSDGDEEFIVLDICGVFDVRDISRLTQLGITSPAADGKPRSGDDTPHKAPPCPGRCFFHPHVSANRAFFRTFAAHLPAPARKTTRKGSPHPVPPGPRKRIRCGPPPGRPDATSDPEPGRTPAKEMAETGPGSGTADGSHGPQKSSLSLEKL